MINPTNPTPALSRRLFLGLSAAAVLPAVEPKVTVPAYNTLTDAEEISLGRKFAGSLEQKLPILDVPILNRYVNTLLTTLGRASRRPNLAYPAKVVNTTDVNAVSLPGGYIFVFRGLLEAVRTEGELVSVLAHEIGHVAARHSANQMMLDFRARQVYELVKQNLELRNTVIEQVLEKFGGPVLVLARLRYSRENEFDADMLGLYNLIRAGWDPSGMVSFFHRLNAARPSSHDWLQDALSTHPQPTERARRIQAEVASLRMPDGLQSDSVSFEAMKLGLKLLPPPVRPEAEK